MSRDSRLQEAIGRMNDQRKDADKISESTPVTGEILGEIRMALYDTTHVGFTDMIQNSDGKILPIRRAHIVEQALQFVESFWRK